MVALMFSCSLSYLLPWLIHYVDQNFDYGKVLAGLRIDGG